MHSYVPRPSGTRTKERQLHVISMALIIPKFQSSFVGTCTKDYHVHFNAHMKSLGKEKLDSECVIKVIGIIAHNELSDSVCELDMGGSAGFCRRRYKNLELELVAYVFWGSHNPTNS